MLFVYLHQTNGSAPGTGIPTGVGTLIGALSPLRRIVEATDVPEVPVCEKPLGMTCVEAAIDDPPTAQPKPAQPKSCVAWLPTAARTCDPCPNKP